MNNYWLTPADSFPAVSIERQSICSHLHAPTHPWRNPIHNGILETDNHPLLYRTYPAPHEFQKAQFQATGNAEEYPIWLSTDYVVSAAYLFPLFKAKSRLLLIQDNTLRVSGKYKKRKTAINIFAPFQGKRIMVDYDFFMTMTASKKEAFKNISLVLILNSILDIARPEN